MMVRAKAFLHTACAQVFCLSYRHFKQPRLARLPPEMRSSFNWRKTLPVPLILLTQPHLK